MLKGLTILVLTLVFIGTGAVAFFMWGSLGLVPNMITYALVLALTLDILNKNEKN